MDIDFQYIQHVAPRYETVLGCEDNLKCIAAGLRSGGPITLNGKVTFTPPTRPMGYGNVTRTLDLASRRLAAAGIARPTAEQLADALMAVLKLRAAGVDWPKIARNVG